MVFVEYLAMNRGVSGSIKGDLVWLFNRIASVFTEPETRICFRYYHGNTGNLRAVTEPILVRNSLASSSGVRDKFSSGLWGQTSMDSEAEIVHLAIEDIEATHVRKGMFFNPDPYVKIRVELGQDRSQPALSYHYKDFRTSVCDNTTEPRWHNERAGIQWIGTILEKHA
ncbi:E3 ubiquitin-protein ligase HECW1-like [Watersipora subatra]|uniref:E3 ubiquitin-protein ligase HECW1-like n=1 Tax=Watersipora subatra TaxID=2589382 RepID=UPI00355B29C3